MSQFSQKDFTGWDWNDRERLDGETIEGSCFSQETPDSHIFPEDMTGVTFIHCNLDNVFIPDGNTVKDCSQKRFLVQNDLRDWYIDADDKPVEVIGKKGWELQGYPTDKGSIPADFVRKETLLKLDYEREKETEEFQSWFLEAPAIVDTIVKKSSIIVTPDQFAEMQASRNYYPFDAQPKAERQKNGNIMLIGVCTIVKIKGKGKIKGGKGHRPFDNSPEDLKNPPQ